MGTVISLSFYECCGCLRKKPNLQEEGSSDNLFEGSHYVPPYPLHEEL